MGGVMAGAVRAPLMAMFIVAEMTGAYSLLLPVALTATLSYLIVKLASLRSARSTHESGVENSECRHSLDHRHRTCHHTRVVAPARSQHSGLTTVGDGRHIAQQSGHRFERHPEINVGSIAYAPWMPPEWLAAKLMLPSTGSISKGSMASLPRMDAPANPIP